MIQREERDAAILLTLNHGKANAIDIELLEGLIAQFAEEQAAGTKAIVLTGSGKIFSAGVNLYTVMESGAEYVEALLVALDRALEGLLAFPRPVVAAVNGHAIAGGCVLACSCDLRLMADGDGRVGLTELPVGVPFPALPLEIVRAVVPPNHLQEVLYSGGTYVPAEAVRKGFVDRVVPAGELVEKAVEEANRLATIEPAVFKVMKDRIRAPLFERYHRYKAAHEDQVRSLWTDPATWSRIRDYVRRVVKKD